jgi:hypothetical protein
MKDGVPLVKLKIGKRRPDSVTCIADSGSMELNIAHASCRGCVKSRGAYTGEIETQNQSTIVYGSQADTVVRTEDYIHPFPNKIPFVTTIKRKEGTSNFSVFGLLKAEDGTTNHMVPNTYCLYMEVPDEGQVGFLTRKKPRELETMVRFDLDRQIEPFVGLKVSKIVYKNSEVDTSLSHCIVDSGSNMSSFPTHIYEKLVKASHFPATLYFELPDRTLYGFELGRKQLLWHKLDGEFMIDDDVGILSKADCMILGCFAMQGRALGFDLNHFYLK